ncbi:MAG TPA: hypothetical protein VIK26_05625 [Clostridium sp.]
MRSNEKNYFAAFKREKIPVELVMLLVVGYGRFKGLYITQKYNVFSL